MNNPLTHKEAERRVLRAGTKVYFGDRDIKGEAVAVTVSPYGALVVEIEVEKTGFGYRQGERVERLLHSVCPIACRVPSKQRPGRYLYLPYRYEMTREAENAPSAATA